MPQTGEPVNISPVLHVLLITKKKKKKKKLLEAKITVLNYMYLSYAQSVVVFVVVSSPKPISQWN